MNVNRSSKDKETHKAQLVTYVGLDIATRFTYLCAENGETVSSTLRQIVQSYCED